MENVLTDEDKKRIWEEGYKKQAEEHIKKEWKKEEREWSKPIRDAVRDAVRDLPLGDLFNKRDIVAIVNDVWDKRHSDLVKQELLKALSDNGGELRKAIAGILSAHILESCFETKEKKELIKKYKDELLPKLKIALANNEMDSFVESVVSKQVANFKVDLLNEFESATSQTNYERRNHLCRKANEEYKKLLNLMENDKN